MKTIEVKLFQYNELSEEAKENVLSHLGDINVDYDWWDSVEEDARDIGLEINEFDIGRNDISGRLIEDPQTVKKLVMETHGETCDTYKYVSSFDMRKECDEDDFKRGLLEEYLSLLRGEYEFLTSTEAIEDSIIANEYDFTESGEWPIY